MLNWIVWNRTYYLYKNGFGIKSPIKVDIGLENYVFWVMEPIKNICCVKDDGVVDYSSITRWFKKFHSGCKNLNDSARSVRLKTEFAIEVKLLSHMQRVSGELSISLSSVVCCLHNLSKSIQGFWIVPHIAKISENFWLNLVLTFKITDNTTNTKTK